MDNPADDLVHERILSRYLHLMEERRKSVDFGIDLVKERDSLAKKIKELSEISSRRENEIQSQSETIKNLQGELIHLRQQHQKISTELIEIGDYTRILEKEISEIRLAHLDLKKHFAEREQSREGLEKAHL
ncbi:MAG: hypothetical protein H3C47_00975, partial [Candidatus Cloacimonetes bacterium]|nr:hypothetical protein [Candidatus Cloacimonadota bacterium]